jgi:hypothetical protein
MQVQKLFYEEILWEEIIQLSRSGVGGRGFVGDFSERTRGWGERIVVESHQNDAVLVLFLIFFF